MALLPGSASATPAPVIRDGRTQPVFSYTEAVRETVFVDAPMDSDRDGRRDRVAVAVLRPAETQQGMKVATVMKATPYTGWAPPGSPPPTVPDPGVFSEWYDEFFVPRGYAVVEVEMQGTGLSEGCPMSGGHQDTISTTAAIDWLNGRAHATYADGRPAVATWSDGAVGMVGLSYDGTLANAAAVQGVQGLKTIVPLGAISSWYDYARDQGIGYARELGNRYPEYQARRLANESAKAKCGDVLTALGDGAGDDTADYTSFWFERDYRRHAERVRASVLLVQGVTDGKVRNRHFAAWWQALADNNVSRKLWLHNGDHEDPLNTGGEAWRDTLHRWMDHWLYRVDNGIMTEPRVTIQRPDKSWQTSADWPNPGSRPIRLWFGPATATAAGSLTPTRADGGSQNFTDDPTQKEAGMIADPGVAKPHRLAYLTPPLTSATHVSGAPGLKVEMSATTTSTPLTALLVDYGPSVSGAGRNAGTAAPVPPGSSADLIAVTTPGKPLPKVLPIVSRGSIDVKNRESLVHASPLTPGRTYTIRWRLHDIDYIFPAGHRIGIVIVANDMEYITTDPSAGSVTLNLHNSKLTLPIVTTG
ncbi:CocE/NonD family hydrolase [Rhizohabitans arisaemae]|uniref:CocE/NonD family hydrolase n=1 Tax=Rhizohabitans arisaemae TaxID=2720610 RepID=UPI0024B2116F|nr:CocE/NonD family hydrolase [Rhizohabitans arisaemae]